MKLIRKLNELKEQENKKWEFEWDKKVEESAEFIFEKMLEQLGRNLNIEEIRTHYVAYVNAFSEEILASQATKKQFRRLGIGQKRRRGDI